MTWAKYAQNPVLQQGSAGEWDSACLGTKSVLLEPGQYTMWYGGSNEAYLSTKIGRATSTDGLCWTKDPGPVLQPGLPGSWDSRGVANGVVIKDGALYKMWYVGFDGYFGNVIANAKVGYATSTDGRLWTKYPGNPVMSAGLMGEWDAVGVIPNAVLLEDNIYKMWYAGLNISLDEYIGIGYATSNDGISWAKHGSNPVLKWGSMGSWDELSIDNITVVNASGTYHVWYSGLSGNWWNIGHATSPDGLNWTRDPANPVLTFGAYPWESWSVIDPFVIYDGAVFRMWYTGGSNYAWPLLYSFGYAETVKPASPIPVRPSDNAITNAPRPSFSWSFRDLGGNSTSTAFRLQLADVSGFSTPFYDSGRVKSPSFAHILGSDLADGSYYWRVMAWDINDVGSNWSNPGMFMVDTSIPANPVGLGSTTHPLASWSGRADITVEWSLPPGGDTGSGYGGFSVLWDNQSSSIPDDTIDVLGTSATSPDMPESDSIFFHLRATDRAGNWNQSALHLGPFWVDPTAPGNPMVLKAAGHSSGLWSNDRVVSMSWSGADGNLSGIGGYSALWDRHPATLPPEKVMLGKDVWTQNSPPLPDGRGWYFHLRTVDAAGNWNGGALHSGPYRIDTGPPSPPSGLASPDNTVRAWSNNSAVEMRWSAAQDPLSGVAGYAHVWDTSPQTVPSGQINVAGGATAVTSPALSDGQAWYFHLRALDDAGNWQDGAVHSGPYWIDSIPPGPVGNLISASHAVGQWSKSDIVDARWSPPDGGPSGISGYCCLWDSVPDTLPLAVKNTAADASAASSPPLGNGDSWYFHIRASDGAGNWAPSAAHLGPFFINTTAPPPLPDNPPVITNLSGLDETSIVTSGFLEFSVDAYDPDGKALTIQWYENGEVLTTGRVLIRVFPPGEHNLRVVVSDGESMTVGTFNFTVIPPVAGNPIEGTLLAQVPKQYIAAGALAIPVMIGISLAAGTEAVKYRLLLLFLPLFTRLHKEEILDNELRGMIRGFIKADPGIYYSELVRQIKAANGTVAYHLMTLEREGLIKSRRDGGLRRFYPGEMRLLEIPVRLSGVQLLILKTVQKQDGLNQRKVAEHLDIPYLTVHRHISKMVKLKVLRLEKAGISTRCFVEMAWQSFDPGENNSRAPAPLTS